MGARQSKRSVDITTTPKKGEGEVVGEGEGKLEKIGDADIKTTTNGAVPHIDLGEKDENAKDAAAEKDVSEEVKENGLSESEDGKTPEAEQSEENLSDAVATAVAEKTPESGGEGKTEDTPETKKQKDKNKKKKWSFRSISFSKKDKQKPSKESEKNGEVKEVAEENAEESATSPSIESPKSEEAKSATEAVSNGDINAEEIAAKAPEEAKPEEPTAAAIEEPKVPEPVVEKPAESAPSPAKEQEEPQPVEPPTPAVEEPKEVRNEEVPPPLPSSNPPSSVTVFAESTKADALTADQVPVLESPIVRTILEAPPLAASSPVAPEEPALVQVPETPKKSETLETENVVVPNLVLDGAEGPGSLGDILPKTPESTSGVLETKEVRSGTPSESTTSLVDQITADEPELPSSEQFETAISPEEPLAEAVPEQKANESLPEADRDVSIKEDENPPATLSNTPQSSETIIETTIEPSAAVPETVSENCEVLLPSMPAEVPQTEELLSPPVSAETSDSPKESVLDNSETIADLKPLEASGDPTSASLETPPSPASPKESLETLPSPASPKESSAFAPEQPASLPDLPSSPIALPHSPPQSPTVGDSSSESLPSLPEPASDLEPMSLPPVESVPEPIATDCAGSVCEPPPPSDSAVLTNGNADGLPSPSEEVVERTATEGPLKQVPAEPKNEVRQEEEEKKDTVVETAAVAAGVEE